MSELTSRDYKGTGGGRRGAPPGGLKEFLWGALAGALLAGLGTALVMHRIERTAPAACAAKPAAGHKPAASAATAAAHSGTTNRRTGSDSTTPRKSSATASTSRASEPAHAHYDFYKMLPNLKVRVPRPSAPGKRTVGSHGHTVFAGYVVQVGSYTDPAQARRIRAELDSLGIIAHIDTVQAHGTTLHRVRIGPLTEEAELKRIRRVLKAVHLPGIVIPGATH